MEKEIRRFSREVAGSNSKYDYKLVKQWDNLSLALPWTFAKHKCSKCGHVDTSETLFNIVSIAAYQPMADDLAVREQTVWIGLNPKGSLSFLPADFVRMFVREVLNLPDGVKPF